MDRKMSAGNEKPSALARVPWHQVIRLGEDVRGALIPLSTQCLATWRSTVSPRAAWRREARRGAAWLQWQIQSAQQSFFG